MKLLADNWIVVFAQGEIVIHAPWLEGTRMSRTIVTISVPIGSVAYDSINKWRANKRNVSELVCEAISSTGHEREHIEGLRRRVKHLELKLHQYDRACSRGGVSLRINRSIASQTYFVCNRTGSRLVEGSFGDSPNNGKIK